MTVCMFSLCCGGVSSGNCHFSPIVQKHAEVQVSPGVSLSCALSFQDRLQTPVTLSRRSGCRKWMGGFIVDVTQGAVHFKTTLFLHGGSVPQFSFFGDRERSSVTRRVLLHSTSRRSSLTGLSLQGPGTECGFPNAVHSAPPLFCGVLVKRAGGFQHVVLHNKTAPVKKAGIPLLPCAEFLKRSSPCL